MPRPPLFAAALACLAPVGTAAFMLFLYLRFGDLLAFVHASAAWEREPQSPISLIGRLFTGLGADWPLALSPGRIRLNDWADLAFVALFLAIGLALLAERRWPEGLLVTLGVLLPLSSGLLMSQRRYMWVLFPAFVVRARWGERRSVDQLIVALSLTLLGLFTALFANGFWVA